MCGRWIGKHYFVTKNDMNIGATTIFEIDPTKWTLENIEKLFETIKPGKNYYPEDMRKKIVDLIYKRRYTALNYIDEPFSFKRLLELQIIVQPSTLFTKYDFQYRTDKIFICFASFIDNLPTTQIDGTGHTDNRYVEKISFYLSLMEKVFILFQPDFGWSDTLDNMIPYVKKDPREHVFGVNYYGMDMVNKIGRAQLVSLPDVKINEFDWGGIIIKLRGNPFHDVGKDLRLEYEKILFNQHINCASKVHIKNKET